MKKAIMLFLFVSFCLSSNSHSALLSINDPAFGAGAITRDTETNLDWLDITLSTNYSYGDILNETGSNGIFSDFRVATFNEVTTLLNNFGANTTNIGGGLDSSNYTPLSNVLSFMGTTVEYVSTGWARSEGFYVPITSDDTASLILGINHDLEQSFISVNYNHLIDETDQYTGAFLVKPVPIPGAAWLLGSGLIGLIGVRRKMSK